MAWEEADGRRDWAAKKVDLRRQGRSSNLAAYLLFVCAAALWRLVVTVIPRGWAKRRKLVTKGERRAAPRLRLALNRWRKQAYGRIANAGAGRFSKERCRHGRGGGIRQRSLRGTQPQRGVEGQAGAAGRTRWGGLLRRLFSSLGSGADDAFLPTICPPLPSPLFCHPLFRALLWLPILAAFRGRAMPSILLAARGGIAADSSSGAAPGGTWRRIRAARAAA